MKTSVVKIDPRSPDKEAILSAARSVREGALVAFPTETVYGIAANYLDKKAIEALYRVKQRPRDKPFTIHISDIDMIKSLGCSVAKEGLILIKRFWPGPLTVILKSEYGETLGFRMPANRIAMELIKSAGVPIVAPSANLTGNKAPRNAEEVLKDLDGRIALVIDGGDTEIGVESTVVDLTVSPPKVLREGAIKAIDIMKAINEQN